MLLQTKLSDSFKSLSFQFVLFAIDDVEILKMANVGLRRRPLGATASAI